MGGGLSFEENRIRQVRFVKKQRSNTLKQQQMNKLTGLVGEGVGDGVGGGVGGVVGPAVGGDVGGVVGGVVGY